MRLTRKYVKRWFRNLGYEVRKLSTGELDDITRLAHLSAHWGIRTFLDVGANQGQFATDLRVAGYHDRIISFEPISEAHAILARRSKADDKWLVADRIALGSHSATTTINVSANSFSSSLLPMAERHVASAPSSVFIGAEEIQVSRLDDVLASMGCDGDEPLALKIDTQGYELEVIAGAALTLPRVKLLFTELSLVPLYEGAPSFDVMYNRLSQLGFRCVALSHEFSDPKTGEMLQVNGTFVKGWE